MYIPAAFAEQDVATLHDFIDAQPLGVLVTATPSEAGGEGLFATHLPLVLDRTRGRHGILQGHVARANAHAHSAQADALVIFTGPDAYVHPGWYPSTREHGRVVPTWNYVAVHAAGTLHVIEDAAHLRRHLEGLTARHEARWPHPWSMADAPAHFMEAMLRDIVGIEIEITRIEGKWKMSQNRTAADIAGVVEGLASSPTAREQEVAAVVQARRPPSKR